MAAPAKPRSSFGDQLREQLDRHESIRSVRRLAQVMRPERPESTRRMLQKWIAGDAVPEPESRCVVAVALGVDPSVFRDGDDDEEEAELADLVRALMHQVGVVVDRRLEERLSREAQS